VFHEAPRPAAAIVVDHDHEGDRDPAGDVEAKEPRGQPGQGCNARGRCLCQGGARRIRYGGLAPFAKSLPLSGRRSNSTYREKPRRHLVPIRENAAHQPSLSYFAKAVRRSRHTITRRVGGPSRSLERLRLASQPSTLSSTKPAQSKPLRSDAR
jgi:hypothetical protein